MCWTLESDSSCVHLLKKGEKNQIKTQASAVENGDFEERRNSCLRAPRKNLETEAGRR